MILSPNYSTWPGIPLNMLKWANLKIALLPWCQLTNGARCKTVKLAHSVNTNIVLSLWYGYFIGISQLVYITHALDIAAHLQEVLECRFKLFRL